MYIDGNTIVTVLEWIFGGGFFIAFYKLVKIAHRLEAQSADVKSLKAEMSIVTKGLLACLEGLAEQGCDGPVKNGVKELKDYLNEKAHE